MSGITDGLSWPRIVSRCMCTALEKRELQSYVEPKITKNICNCETHIPLVFRGKTCLSQSGFYSRHLPEISQISFCYRQWRAAKWS